MPRVGSTVIVRASAVPALAFIGRRRAAGSPPGGQSRVVTNRTRLLTCNTCAGNRRNGTLHENNRRRNGTSALGARSIEPRRVQRLHPSPVRPSARPPHDHSLHPAAMAQARRPPKANRLPPCYTRGEPLRFSRHPPNPRPRAQPRRIEPTTNRRDEPTASAADYREALKTGQDRLSRQCRSNLPLEGVGGGDARRLAPPGRSRCVLTIRPVHARWTGRTGAALRGDAPATAPPSRVACPNIPQVPRL